MNEIQYERLTSDRIKDVVYLIKTVFKRNVSEEDIQKKYSTDYTGTKYLCFLAYLNAKPISFCGSLPFIFHCNSEDFLATHACDAYTLVEHQQKGLHYQLATRSYELMKQNKVRFAFAMHSDNTFRATKKLGWGTSPAMRRFHIKTGALPITQVAAKWKVSDQQMHRRLNKKVEPFLIDRDEPNPLNDEGWVSTKYPKGYYDWKVFTNNHLIQIEGVKFFVKMQSVLHIGFFAAPNAAQFQKGLEGLKKLCRSCGIAEILFQVSQGSVQEKQLSDLQQGQDSWIIGHLNFDLPYSMDDLKLNYADLDSY